MEVSINREKVWKRKIMGNIITLLFGVLIIPIMKFLEFMAEDLSYPSKEYNFTIYTILLIVLWVIFVLIKLWLDKLYSNTIKYDIEDDRLIKSWKTIVKTKYSARLQIINSVDVTQGLIDKLFDMFSFEIRYGMGEGHYFSFPYLSEVEANKLMDTIKPSGKNILIK